MGRFYEKRIDESPDDLKHFVIVSQAAGGSTEVQVTQGIFDALDDLQREHWKYERRESRHTYHIEMMQERELPHSQYSKDPEQILIEQIETTEIKTALRGIPVIQQKRFLMHHLIGLSIKQIAKLEGCSDRAIKYSLALARSNLRNILSE